MTTTEFHVTGMTCGHCENAVREEVSAIPGVSDVSVSHTDGHLTITSAGTVDRDAVAAAVEEAGYRLD
ncbi:heavy-metal-associated domain-containing protein [Corynebacterium uberis]|uniref:heavy-metal-associated domain-containing protein n=1 Tax=Corynebacterium TaxID=1716 RepID=UPI001D0B7F6E|nr:MULTISPECIES: heavy-metal-associated domain-containing protein [Corynebacterium]MCZ9309075.1 heavy-metal-associated domain-containing protein [Corynebacterium sp. c6VSa_13]UDL74460.1 heavy-metal-associated domain-containing protein [Corynebacterium uberis]UDL76705.1 heavy-metal-associated domain-containing protein [Corynebacterium uberis]UDL78918.1 heavy-metal-associated domain-containing protein [Corynebacterium uberis]UDL81196.1 heavy-metal-associated domain-containing protein [Corynebact